VALSRLAIADPAPAASGRSPRLYNTISMGAAVLDTESSSTLTTVAPYSSTDPHLAARIALGVALVPPDQGFGGRLGPFVDVYYGPRVLRDRHSVVYGLEAEGDRGVGARWRLGLRFAFGARSEGGTALLAGVHLRDPHLTVGIDAVRMQLGSSDSYHWSSTGVVVTGGLEGRPALIGTGIVA